ncbi:trypsin-like serine protease [Heliocybe sulcata]|uniref:Serine protease n=1 Tax=Heliocybe sulcata TaxID=5364 RepID=A0A5C3N762_9AGAM|nr:trypsin-like serine protease [Heliocybe sulcata]
MVYSLQAIGVLVLLVSSIHALPNALPERNDNADLFHLKAERRSGQDFQSFTGPVPSLITWSRSVLEPYMALDSYPPSTPRPARRNIQGTDDRVPQTSTSFPFTAVGRVEWSDGYWCSGSLVGPRHVATAKHCAPVDGEQVSVRFAPGYNNGNVSAPASLVTDMVASTSNSGPAPCFAESDWALFVLEERVGDQVGWFGARVLGDGGDEVVGKPVFTHVGYPEDKGNYTMWGQTGITVRGTSCDSTGPLDTDADVIAGQSGGPIWYDDGEDHYVYGVLSSGDDTVTRFSSGDVWLAAINKLKADYP